MASDTPDRTYRVRVMLNYTDPPTWRRLDLASSLTLDLVHDAIQATFGWTHNHLHRFVKGAHPFDESADNYLMDFEVGEGDPPGTPETDVRLQEVLTQPGDHLLYLYDFGDDWQHTVELEAIADRAADEPPAVCVDGERPSLTEDSGGVHGYEMFVAANDPSHPRHEEALADLADRSGEDIDPSPWAPIPFDLDKINATLSDLAVAHRGRSVTLPP